MERAKKAGVGYMLNAGGLFDALPMQLEICRKYPNVFTLTGVHPHDANAYVDVSVEDVLSNTKNQKVIGIGECGLDYYYDFSPRDVQIKVFRKMIQASQESGLPLVVHTRDAEDDTIELLADAYKQKSLYLNDDDWGLRHKYLTDALNAYKNAVKILKKDYDARYNLALTYHLLGDYHNAGLTYCKAIQLSPMSYEAHYNLAVLLRHLKYYKESLDEMEKATSLITDSEGATNRQRYIFDVMNDVTREYIAEKGQQYFVEALSKEQLLNRNLTYVDGRLVSADELDKTMMKNLKTCGSKKIFLEDIDEDYVEAQDRGRVFLPPVE